MNTLWFCLLPCKWQHNGDVNSMEQQRGPVVYWCEQRMSYSWAWSKAKECDHKLRLFLYFVLIGFFLFLFFLVCIIFQCDDYLNIFFSLNKPEQEHTGSDGPVCCEGACELGDGFGCACAGRLGRPRPRLLRSVHTARGCVSWMTQASQDHAV